MARAIGKSLTHPVIIIVIAALMMAAFPAEFLNLLLMILEGWSYVHG